MSGKKSDEYIKERYEDQVNWYDKKAIRYKNFNDRFRILTILVGSVVPVLALMDYPLARTLTVILSALVAILMGVLNYFKFEEKWHNYRSTCETLKKEKYYYQYKINEYGDTKNPDELFIQRVEAIISREHTQWLRIEKSKKKENK